MQTQTIAGLVLVRRLIRRAAALTHAWRKLIGEPYRPEKHYMRGPGPKWREKNGASRNG